MIKLRYLRTSLAPIILGILIFNFVIAPLSDFVMPASAWEPGWQYRKPITINHAMVTGDLANFPVLIDITDSDLVGKAQPDGDDIKFANIDDSQLSHEIEYYNAGHLVAWVKVPNLSSSVDTTLYMYYGNADVNNQENPSGVWDSNFMMVQHLSESSGLVVDSTANNNDGSPVNGVVQGATGKVDGADDFDGSNDYVTVSDSDSLAGFTQGFSASFWVRLDSVSGRQTLLNKWNAGTGQRAWFVEFDSSQTNKLTLYVSEDGTAYSFWRALFNPVVGDWYHITVVWRSGQQPLFYVNGASVTATTATARSSVFNNAEPLYIGRSYTTGRYFNGVLDEVCLSDSVRSSEWLLTSYANQVNPLGFYAVGPEESAGGPVNSAPVISDVFPLDGATNVPVSLDELSVMVSDPDSDVMNISCTTEPDIGHSEGLGLPDTLFTVVVTGLNPNTNYEWNVSVTDGVFWTNMTYSFTTETPAPTPPTVIGVIPVSGAIVPVTTTIDVNFSEPMDQTSTEAAFSLDSVTGSFNWPNSSALIFTPSMPLAYSTVYNITVTTAAKDIQGENMSAPHICNFITEMAPQPSSPILVSVVPVNDMTNLAVTTTVVANFSEPMNQASTEDAFSINPFISGVFTWDNSSALQFTPSVSLTYSTVYSVTISTTAKSLENENTTELYSWSFTTIPAPIPPFVVSTVPLNDATGVPVSSSVQVTFSEAMDRTATEDAFLITGAITGIFAWNSDNTTMTFTPNAYLTTSKVYTATILATAKDMQDENIASPYSWSFTTAGPTPGSWYNTDWQYRKQITILHSQVVGTLTDFPVLIDIIDSDLINDAQSDGDDILFIYDRVKLDHEIEFFNADHLIAWVKVPALSSSVDTTLYMYYGNALAENPQNPTAVWDANFVLVQHLSEGSGVLLDSTSNNNDGSPINGVIQAVGGKVDGATDFDGINDYISVSDSSTLAGFTDAFTASFWVRMDSVSGRQTFLNEWNSGVGRRAWFIDYDSARGANTLGLFVSADGSSYSYWYAAFSPTVGNWYHITVVWQSGQQPVFYVNGVAVARTTSTVRASIFNNAEPLYIGRSYASSRYLNGVLDEVCLSNSDRSAEWIQTSHNNQINPSFFFTVASEESSLAPVVSGLSPLNGAVSVPISLSQLTFTLQDPNGDAMRYYVATSPNIGSDSQTNQADGTKTIAVSGLSYNTLYTWYISVTDGTYWTNMTYTFTTEPLPPQPPLVSGPTPANGQTNVPVSLNYLSFTISDVNDDLMNVTCTTSPNIGASSGLNFPDEHFIIPVENLNYGTTYTWRVSVTDGTYWTNMTYTFTTESQSFVKRKTLTINHELVAANLVNFPVLIDVTDSDLASKAQPDGSDIYFTDANNVQLSYEIEFYGAGHLVAWVKLPSLSSSVNTTIYVCYGFHGAGNPEDPVAVWDSNYIMVQHLEEGLGTLLDSTSYSNNGSPINSIAQGATGKIDGAVEFDGSNDYITVPHSSSLTGFSQGFTASFWVRMDSVTGRQTFLNKWNSEAGTKAWFIDYDSARGANTLGLFVSADGSSYSYWYAAFSPTVGNWYHITVVWQSGQQPVFYVNGVVVTSTTSTVKTSIFNDAEPLFVGRSYTAGRYFNGVLDEVCLSSSVRSAEWTLTSVNNQLNPSSFVTIGSIPTPPNVVSNAPLDGVIGVSPTTTVQVIFSEAMDRTATQSAFSISPFVTGTFTWNSGNTTMTFTPSTSLMTSTTYTIMINTIARDMQKENLLSPYSWSFTTETGSGPTPPYVTNHIPLAGSTGVSPATIIQVTFSQVMNRTATEDAFSISPFVAGSFAWNSDNTTMTFTPHLNLAAYTLYYVTINTAAKDMQGENIASPYGWGFTTGIGSQPYVVSVTPTVNAINVYLTTTIVVTFSEAMDHASVENSFSISPSVGSGLHTFTWDSSDTIMTVTLNSPLQCSTIYTVTLSNTAKDTYDENMATPYTWTFTTIPHSPPSVTLPTIPATSETNVTSTIWGVSFSEPMDINSTQAAFSISISPISSFAPHFLWVNNSYVNFYVTPLKSNSVYTVTISTNARDQQGENLTSNYIWSFTTGNINEGPITFKWSHYISGLGTGESSPLIGDVTSDPGEEIIYVGGDTGSASGAVVCLSGVDGHEIWRYNDTAIGWNVQPQMGDIDNDGQYEIVVPLYSPTGILVLNTDRTNTGNAAFSLYWKRTGIGGSSYTSKPLLVDPDGDGYWMVIGAPEDVRGYSNTNTYTSRVWTFNYDGREIKNDLWGTPGGNRTATNGYNATLGSERYQWFAWRPCSGGFSMADTDNDGLFELYQNDRDMYYSDGGFAKGTICWEWNATSQSLQLKWYQPDMLVSSHTPILVDVNKDGVLDVIVAHMRGGLAVFNSTSGAEIKKDYNLGLPSHYQPVVYDIDRDGNPEILLADGDHGSPDIVVFDLTRWTIDARIPIGPCKFPPTVGEVTGDGIMDIIAVSDTGVFVCDGSHNPAIDHTYPITVLPLPSGLTALPYQCMYAVVQDIDNDLKNEIVVTSSSYMVYAWDTEAPRTTPRPRSEVQYYNERRTGVAEYVPPVFYDRTTPILSDAYPSHEATIVPVDISQLRFTIEDLQGDLMDYVVTANFPVDSADLARSSVYDGTYYVDVTGTLAYHTRYTWRVSVTDGVHWNNKTYTFTTPEGTPPGSPPTQGTPLLISSGIGEYINATTSNLICTNQTTADQNGDKVTNIYNWQKNGQSIANLIMPFDTDSLTTAKDYSGYNNNAEIHGAIWTNNGKVGGAYSFDGVDDYMKISDGGAGYYNGRIYPSNLGGQGNWTELTVEMWINLAALSTKESTRLLMKLPSYEIGLGAIGGSDRNTDRLTAGVWLDNPDSGDNAGPPDSNPKADEYMSVTAPSNQALSINTWYHVAFTYKDGKGTSNTILTLYVNGVAVSSSSSLTTRGPIKASSGEPLYIGWFDYFKGMIDEVRIYSVCLSGNQISQRYNETKDGLTNSSTLTDKETRTGETWTCQVTPNDSHQDGTAIASNPLLVLPGPQVAPVVSNVRVIGQESLSTSLVWSNESIIAYYECFDQNDDPIVFGGPFGTQIRWYRNNVYQPSFDNMTILTTDNTIAHEDWTFQIKLGDGYSVASDWTSASNKVIVNSPPVITSYSPHYGPTQTSLTMNVGDSQTFSFTYEEMDGDPVIIVWQANGVNVAENVLSYDWTATELGSDTVRVTVTDTGYGSTYTRKSWNIVVR